MPITIYDGFSVFYLTVSINNFMAARDDKRWIKLNQVLEDYQKYLTENSNRNLNYIDLLFISNFKGGNASITDPMDEVNRKLIEYSKVFTDIGNKFKNRSLNEFSENDIHKLLTYVHRLFHLINSNEHSIAGFKHSYLSALLHAHFPNIFPILDRRVLINAGLVNSPSVYKSGQVKNFGRFYPTLIRRFRGEMTEKEISIRELDHQYFGQDLNLL